MSVVTEVAVDGLYGEFNHKVTFNEDWQFAIIYGPNGIGKTRFFEIIHDLSRLRTTNLARAPFHRATIRYSDDARLAVTKGLEQDSVTLTFELKGSPHRRMRPWKWRQQDEEQLARRMLGPRWHDMGDGMWMDDSDGEVIAEGELLGRYGFTHFGQQGAPEEMQAFIESRQTHLIETQRLTGRHSEPGARGRQRRFDEDTVSFYAGDMKRRLEGALGENSRVSQSLDRTFPERLLAAEIDSTQATESEIRSRYEQQNEKRSRLADLGLTRESVSVELPDTGLDRWKLGVLELYLRDTEEKLGSFDDILRKVDLLRSIINRRFLRKQIEVNSDVGLAIVPTGRGEHIHPRLLSSGEKHELIMFYDLLFRASPGTLVLIDEPEISLHVSWQREFLNDIAKVAELAGIRALIATHSPQIIGPHRAQTTDLGTEADIAAMGE